MIGNPFLFRWLLGGSTIIISHSKCITVVRILIVWFDKVDLRLGDRLLILYLLMLVGIFNKILATRQGSLHHSSKPKV